MHLRGNSVGPGTRRNEDYRLGTAAGFVVAAYAGFFLVLYWLMQPSVVANPGLAGYRPPPKTIVRYADSPWVPPDPSEPFPIRATREPGAEIAKSRVTEEPKKEVKKQEARTAPRHARPAPAQQQQNPFWGGFASSRSSFGSRPWF
jgi:hypothetical protein